MHLRQSNVALLCIALLACGDGTGPGAMGSALTFTQTGIGTVFLPGAKAVFVVYGNGNFSSQLHTRSVGQVPRMIFAITLDSLPPTSATPITYDPVNFGPGSIAVGMVNALGEKAYPDSGTVTLTRVANGSVEGNLSVRFTFIQFNQTQPPPFTLTGSFALTKTATLPLPSP